MCWWRHITLSEARSRLYQHRFLQPNSHFAAFFKIDKIFTILRRSNLKICKISSKFSGFWRKNCKISKNFKIFSKNLKFFWNFSENFEQFSPKNWVPSGAKVCKSCRSWKMLKNAEKWLFGCQNRCWYSRERASERVMCRGDGSTMAMELRSQSASPASSWATRRRGGAAR